MTRTYLDWAAAAPVSPQCMRTFTHALRAFGNPSSPHAEGRAAKEVLEDARTRIARLAMVKPDAVTFTSGATEANALGIVGSMRALWDAGTDPKDIHVLYLPSAHASTQGAIKELRSWGVDAEPLSVMGGVIDLARLKTQVRPSTALMVLEAVCGETGTRFDTRAVRRAIGEKILIHVDASQLPLVESFELTRLSADTLSLDAQKAGGVRGIGVLIAPRQVSLAPLIRGGGQERGLRPGTEASALAAAFAHALEEAHDRAPGFHLRATDMRKALMRHLPACHINGGEAVVPHILNISLPGRDTDYLVALLDEAGFAVATRSACATNEEGSVAVLAMTGDETRAASTLRVSWGPKTNPRDLTRFAKALVRAVRFLDMNAV